MMGVDLSIDWQMAAASALEWWGDAGVDATVDESPRDWTARVEPVRRVAAAPAVAEIPAPALPDTLAAFESWRLGPEAPEAGWPGRPIGPQGSAASGLMVLVDLPDREDSVTGLLMSGAVGRLFDRMLAAIGRDRASIYLASVCTTRPGAGRIAPEIEGRLNEIVRHQVMLAAPKRLLLLGNAPSRALIGADFARARGGLHEIKLSGGMVPGRTSDAVVQAVASFHPRFLLERPAAKAEAWKDLQMLIEGLEE